MNADPAAEKFERFVSVLNDVADGTLASGARDERSVLRLYERWVRTETEPAWLAPPAAPLLDLHRAIYDAVAAADPEAASAAVLRHHQVMLEHLRAAHRVSTPR